MPRLAEIENKKTLKNQGLAGYGGGWRSYHGAQYRNQNNTLDQWVIEISAPNVTTAPIKT